MIILSYRAKKININIMFISYLNRAKSKNAGGFMKTEFLRREKTKKEKAMGKVFDILVLSLVMSVLVSVIFLINHNKIEKIDNDSAVSVFRETPFYDFFGFDTLENKNPVSEKPIDKSKEEMVSEYINSGGSVDLFGYFFDKNRKE